ncbi:MAG TPA: hypothetical protein VHB72_03960 [Candidatus Saccharimonadales bacterium]|nr:hypothetical protein [Candidatus Saccharimonadales bacterium]
MAQAEQTGSSYFDAAQLRGLPFGQLSEVLLTEAEKVIRPLPGELQALDRVEAASMGLPTCDMASKKLSEISSPLDPFVAIDRLKHRIENGINNGFERGRPWTESDLTNALGRMCMNQARVGIAVENDFIRRTAMEHLGSAPGNRALVLLELAAGGDEAACQLGINALQERLEETDQLEWQEAYNMCEAVLKCFGAASSEEQGVLAGVTLDLLAEMKAYTGNDWAAVDYAVMAAQLSAELHSLPSEASVQDYL